jgi:glycosyltransferase involved in cell wall biosynthesis
MFLYWGRKGSLGRFTLQLMQAVAADPGVTATLSLSERNENFADFAPYAASLMPIRTEAGTLGMLTGMRRIPALRRAIAARAKGDRIDAAITLMPHVYSGLVAPVFHRLGIPYATILHDFSAHPGDRRTRLAMPLMMRDIRVADRVLTLSGAVADRLAASGMVETTRIRALFHPDLDYGAAFAPAPPVPGEPLRLLFLGRILAYKGLSLLIEAMTLAGALGAKIALGVHGEGTIGEEDLAGLRRLGADIANHWHSDEEIGWLLPHYHAVVLSHLEASQSGVAAAAFGAGLPVITTPVGGLPEQVEDGVTGLVAREVSAPALADAIRRLATTPGLYRTLIDNIAARRSARAMPAFLSALTAAVPAAGGL